MQQKTKMWMRYLTLGLIINVAVLFVACTKTIRYEQVGDFYFVNETNYAITYPIGYEAFNIPPKSTVLFKQTIVVGGEREKETAVSDYLVPLLNITGPIKFGNLKCLNDIKLDDVHSLRNVKNYQAEKVGKHQFKFTYTFTEADYNRTANCP